ncbi:hypothetical protein AMTRI_Chr06g200210 [Amborella trichopoda]
MAVSSSIDPKNGFCRENCTFYSLHPPLLLPSPCIPLDITSYSFSLYPPSDSPAIIDASNGARISHRELRSLVLSLSSSLQHTLDIRKGDAVLILSSPSIYVPALYLAILSLGAIVTTSNPLSTESELEHQIGISKPVLTFTHFSLSHKTSTFRHRVIAIDSPEFRELAVPSKPVRREAEIHQNDPATILYSSGTTGRVKGVLSSHLNYIAVVAGYKAEAEDRAAPPIALMTVPLFHIFGFFMVLKTVALGETMVLMPKFEFSVLLRAVEKYRVTYMPVAPPLVVALAKADEVLKYDLSSLETIGSGGAPLGKGVIEKFAKRFPKVEVRQGYGLTESTGTATRTTRLENKKHGSAGKLSANIEARIVDPETNKPLAPGMRGELWLRSPTNMKGYVGNAEATAATLDHEGWLKTGDLCYIDDEGYLFVVDRLKELIKYKAYQVPPAELEHLLLSHPEIADAAVIPYPDEEAGQIPMAFVVRRPGSSLSEKQVMEFIAKQVAPYKKIRKLSFVGSIPKSPAGKILRKDLVAQARSPASKL